MKKVGILNCSNTTQELNCSASMCIMSANSGLGKFENHNDEVQLIGIASCAGCPTAVAPEKIFRKIEALQTVGAEAIHFSTCVETLCPFKNKYKSVIEEKFPEIEILIGTHGAGISGMTEEQEKEIFKSNCREMLQSRGKDITDMVKQMQQN